MTPRKATGNNKSDEDKYHELLSGVEVLAKQIQSLNKQATKLYSPLVNGLIKSKSRNKKQIERTFDELLTFCGYEPAVRIFRKLNRYYSQVDQEAAAEYVEIYLDMWER